MPFVEITNAARFIILVATKTTSAYTTINANTYVIEFTTRGTQPTTKHFFVL